MYASPDNYTPDQLHATASTIARSGVIKCTHVRVKLYVPAYTHLKDQEERQKKENKKLECAGAHSSPTAARRGRDLRFIKSEDPR